jgi:hypothetical protein
MISSSGARTVGPSHAAAANDATASIVVGVAAVDRAFKILAAFETSYGICRSPRLRSGPGSIRVLFCGSPRRWNAPDSSFDSRIDDLRSVLNFVG